MRCSDTGKVAFDRRHDAVINARRQGGHRSVYRCPYCGLFHVTSQPPRVQRAIRMLLESV